ncbi:MAG: 50S ribosomal protein L21 [Bacteroidales bacterium]|nr:50S ribosomal protein L21 [Bacteroidales bacterium]
MYAIVEIAGQQFKVEKKQEIFVHRLEEKEGSKVEFSEVFLIDNDGKVNVGTPIIKGALVSAKILEHMKGDKVLIFKKKRRKGYQKLNGHRQYMTRLVIENILEKSSKTTAPKPEVAATKPKVAATKKVKPASAKVTADKKVKKAAPKKTTATKKAAPKTVKPAAKTEIKKAAPKKEAKPKAAPKAKKADSDKKEEK